MIKLIFEIIVYIILSLLLVYCIGFIILTINYMLEKKKSIKEVIIKEKYPFIYEVVKWHIIDIIRNRDFFELFGIWCFTGYYGQGKTLGAVMYAMKLKKKYPYIHIYSNFNLKGQDGRITKWQDLLELPQNSIVIFDEIQSTFASTQFKDFPLELLWKLTQCRKSKLAIFASSPVYSRMSIQLRESTDYVIECKNMFKRKRWFVYKFYHASDYEKYQDDKDKLRNKRVDVKHIVASDDDYDLYDTSETVQRFDITDNDVKVKGLTRNDVEKIIDYKLKSLIKKYNIA